MYKLKYMLMKTIALSNKSLGCLDLHLCRWSFKSNVPFKSNQMLHCNKISPRDNRTSVNY